jgi:diadenosine tetraphosphate (Ap4A) HIT family hydrolase
VSRWNDSESWAALIDGSACPICKQGQPHDILATLEATWVTMQEAAPVRGYACLVSRTHVVEVHDLDDASSQAFMRDVRRLSGAVQAATGAVKLNYEIHGNTLPHLHMHIFPRYPGDQFEGRPIDPKAVIQPVYQPGQLKALRGKVLQSLRASAP